MIFLWERISYYSSDLTGLHISSTQLSISFFLSTAAPLVRSSHPIIQSARSLFGVSPTMHLVTSLTFTVNLPHMPFISYRLPTLLPSHLLILLCTVVSSSILGLQCTRIPISLHLPTCSTHSRLR